MNLQKKEIDLLHAISHASITVISHDAGGANVLEAFVRAHNLSINEFFVSGPASEIFSLENKQQSTLDLSKPKIFLASTGWQTDFEISHIAAALSQEERVIVFLDHWSNFEQRLKYHSRNIFVRELVTFDEKAKGLAISAFQDSEVFCFTNYYLHEQSKIIFEQRFETQKFIYDFLFIGEPIRGENYSEEDAFRYFIKKVSGSGSTRPSVAIRPHPSQPREIYITLAEKYANFEITVTDHTSLYEDLSNTKFVVGCHSMALELASMSGIPVFSAVPDLDQNVDELNSFSYWKL